MILLSHTTVYIYRMCTIHRFIADLKIFCRRLNTCGRALSDYKDATEYAGVQVVHHLSKLSALTCVKKVAVYLDITSCIAARTSSAPAMNVFRTSLRSVYKTSQL